MINIKQRLKKDGESGEIMLEAAIVLLMVFTIIFAMFSLGFMYYQKVMVQTIANEAASYAATNYKYIISKNSNDMDIDDYDITMFDYTTSPDDDYVPAPLKMFRTAFSVGAFERQGKNEVEYYVKERVQQSSFGINDSVVVDNFEVKVDNVGRAHIDCTVSVKCEVVFAGFLEFLGVIDDSTVTFSASSRAEVVDITSYASYVNFVGYFGRVLGSVSVLNDIADSGYSVADSISTIIDIIAGE